jgi:O-methyltransferase
MNLEGDVCEFGVAQGELSAVLANEIMDTPKRLHLFDSFEGLPAPSEKDKLIDDVLNLGSMEAYAGKMASPECLVVSRLESIGFSPARTVIHKGFFDKLLPKKLNFPERVAFAYVDFDFHDPIKQALEFLDEVACPGAIFVVDDYDYFSTGAKEAVDAFVDKKNFHSKLYKIKIPDKALAHCAVLTKL